MKRDVSALILAGGKATRFGGVAKHELVVDGETIFARQVKVLAPRVAEILISGPVIEGYRTVRDSVEGVGPLAGIAAGLTACTTEWLLVVAGDMPHLTERLIIELVESIGDVDAVGIRIANLPEPLVCVLHRRVLPTIEKMIASGSYKASRLLTDQNLRVRWLEARDTQALRNVNAPEDL